MMTHALTSKAAAHFRSVTNDGELPPVCPWTGETMRPWLMVPGDHCQPGKSGPFQLFWSAKSEYGQLSPRPTVGEVQQFYDFPQYYTHGDDQNAAVAEAQSGLTNRVLLHLAWRTDRGAELDSEVLGLFGSPHGHRLLDIGCGNGAFLSRMEKNGMDVVGVEPDSAAREVARARGLRVFDGTAESMPPVLEGELFDIVVMIHVLEHVLDPIQVLSNVKSLLQPGGFAIIETPNNSALGLTLAQECWPWLDVPRHLNFFTRRSLVGACGFVGLAPVRTSFVGYSRQFCRSWQQTESKMRYLFRPGTPGSEAVRRNAWLLLTIGNLLPRRFKYDSVRVCATG